MRSAELAGVYNSGAGSAGIKEALDQFDPQRSVTWITHELSDDHRQFLQSGVLDMVIDQDPDMQALLALHYLVECANPNPPRTLPGSPGCEFRVYFTENVTEGQYLPPDDRGPNRARG